MDTFEITYRVTLLEGRDIEQKVEDICLEQSVELPRQLLSQENETKVVGTPSKCEQIEENVYEVGVSWPLKNIGGEISQFLNILYGNISLQAGIRITGADWNVLNGVLFGGPAFGIQGIRRKFNKNKGALGSGSLKPQGTESEGIEDIAFQLAAGGLDLMKDDHGLANQEHAPFENRVKACVAALQKAEDETGQRSYYFPHITALADETVKRYQRAAELGADGVLVCPHIAGMETMHQLARMDIDLPIMAHPAFSGGLTRDKQQGIAPDFLYGQLWRALGADFVVFPNPGGRISLKPEECRSIHKAASTVDSPFKPSFPMVGGGMKRSDIPSWMETYGPDTVFLLENSLYEHPDGLRDAAAELSEMLK